VNLHHYPYESQSYFGLFFPNSLIIYHHFLRIIVIVTNLNSNYLSSILRFFISTEVLELMVLFDSLFYFIETITEIVLWFLLCFVYRIYSFSLHFKIYLRRIFLFCELYIKSSFLNKLRMVLLSNSKYFI
jgi:hypothetical protein